MEETFDKVNAVVTRLTATVLSRLMPFLMQFKYMGPLQIIKLILIFFCLLCILPTGIMFPTPLHAPLYRVVKVPGYETMPAILYTQRRPRKIVPWSKMNEKNQEYLFRSYAAGSRLTPDDISNGCRPPSPAIVFIQTQRDVAKHAPRHPKGIQEWFGHLSPEVLDTLSNLNDGNIDIWIVAPKTSKELAGFFKEHCWFRPVMLVPLGASAMRTFQATYVADESNLFPIFVNGMLLVNPLFRESDLPHFSPEQRLLVSSLRVAVISTYNDVAKKALRFLVPTSVNDTRTRVAVASPEFAQIVTDFFITWNKK